ncbi:MAG TPA: hypothetical protein VHF92_08845 [Geodermatophilus sp.]|nr:hypothetical protein [Geodermatophilus sp.]
MRSSSGRRERVGQHAWVRTAASRTGTAQELDPGAEVAPPGGTR